MSQPDFSGIDQVARSHFDAAYKAREQALSESRRVIRSSANAIRSIHRSEWDTATTLMDQAAELLMSATSVLVDHPQILHAGFVADAAKEYAEARLTYAFSIGGDVPLPADLGVGLAPYLNGLGEAVGELRRRLLDLLRDGDIVSAESTLVVMDAAVDFLASLDYPDGMTGGLRRTTDVARSLVERSRSDLTATVVQERLREDLKRMG